MTEIPYALVSAYGDWRDGFYKAVERNDEGSPRGYGAKALKRELIYNGAVESVNPDSPNFGDAARNATKTFQARFPGKLTPDGVIGPRTAKQLFQQRVYDVEGQKDIPNHYLCRMLDLESAWYPAAHNDSGDTGLAQINLPTHAEVSEEKAYDPAFSMNYAADRLKAARAKLKRDVPGKTWTQYWWAAIFAHNAPAFADDWLREDLPATGGKTITVGGKEWDMFEWATLYVTVVLNRTC